MSSRESETVEGHLCDRLAGTASGRPALLSIGLGPNANSTRDRGRRILCDRPPVVTKLAYPAARAT